MKKLTLLLVSALMASLISACAQQKSLHQLQQEFVDLRFGMFIHFGLPTFQEADWTDPQLSPEVFNPVKLDTDQWVKVAKSAGAKFICISVKFPAMPPPACRVWSAVSSSKASPPTASTISSLSPSSGSSPAC